MAKLLSGTRIYGTANVDSQIYVGANVSISTTGINVGNTFTVNTSLLYFNANVNIASNGDIIFSGNSGIYANGSLGTAGQVLTSNATTVYWSTVSGGGGGGGFSNGQSISVANLAITGSLTVANSVGTSGQALISTGTGVQWGALSPGYNYSSQFNGSSSQYLTTGANSLTSENFTIECWFYISGALTYALPGSGYWGMLVSGTGNVAGAIYFVVSGSTTTPNSFAFGHVYSSGSQPGGSCSTTIPVNTWNHVALSRSGSTFAIWFNGVKQTVTTSGTTAAAFVAAPLHIGASPSGGSYIGYFPGYISNFRIVKGTPVYDPAGGNITVPTSPLSVVSGTYLLTCNAITPSDSSTNNFQITNVNGVTTSAVQSPFASTTVSIPTASLTAVRQQFVGDGSTTVFNIAGGYTPNAISVFVTGVLYRNGSDVTVTNGSTIVFATAPLSGALIDVIGTVPTTYSSITPVSYSVSFNSSGQSLAPPTNAAFAFGTGDFTIEFWAYSTDTAGSSNRGVIDTRANATSTSGLLFREQSSTTFDVRVNNASLFTSASKVPNVWQHIAIVKISGTIVLYVNGVNVGSAASATSLTDNYFRISGFTDSQVSPYAYLGYISNVRVVKGLGVYTGAFTPPQSPLQATQIYGGPTIQAITGTQTSLLTCNAPTIIDGSTNAFTITNNGSTPVSTAIVPTFTNVTINNSYSGGIVFSDGTSFGTAQSLGPRNRVINGAMQIWQRGTSFTGLTTNAYTADRFAFNIGTPGTGVFSMTQSTDVPAGQGFPYSLLLQPTTAMSSLGVATYASYYHAIEGFNASDLMYGTSSAKTVTLSYWVKTNFSATLSGMMLQKQAATPRCFPWNFSVTSGNWTKVVVTIPGDVSGTILNSNLSALELDLVYMSIGSNYSAGSTTLNAWNVNTSSNQFASQSYNYASSTSNTIQVTGVQLEVGTVATPFEFRQYGHELILCQRYFQLTQYSVYGPAGNPATFAKYMVQVRATPTITVTIAPTYTSSSALTIDQIGINGNRFYISSSGGGYADNFTYTISAEL